MSCELAAADGNTCVVVLGRLQVYTEGSDSSTEVLQSGLTSEIDTCMELGSGSSHEDIVRITHLPEFDIDRIDAVNEQQIRVEISAGRSRDNFVAIVVGSTSGAALLLFAVAAIRRRRSDLDDEEE